MAHHIEPMDVDSDFDNKENSLHHNNVLPFTEKGYEELDVSELNMKLRYSITPASSPMSKSYTANCVENRSFESGDDSVNVTINENSNLTRSLNSNMTKNDNVVKPLNSYPLQTISTEQFADNSRSTSVLRPLDTTVTLDNANVTITVSGPNDIDENLSLLSSSSSAVQTPEATTPTKDNLILKNDGGSSPIMRSIKSVLNMFRSSQSPIPPADSENIVKPDILSPAEPTLVMDEAKSQALLASTPISTRQKKEPSPTKRNSPQKESIVFNEDLEKELQWKDETTILFSQERIPIHKLFFQHIQTENKNTKQSVELPIQDVQDDMNSTVEYMDISYNDSLRDKTMTDTHDNTNCTFAGESDTEFVDCETTFIKNDSLLEDTADKTPVNNETQNLYLTKEIESTKENTSASRLKQIILNTTQDILDATLSITPEDLMPEALLKTQDKSGNEILDKNCQSENREVITPSDVELEKVNETIDSRVFVESQINLLPTEENLPALNVIIDGKIGDNNQFVDNTEELNVTATAENIVESILHQALESTNSLSNVEFKEEPDAQIIEMISSETLTFDIQHNIIKNLNSTICSETPNEQQIDHSGKHSANNNDNLLTQNIAQDIELNKTNLNNTVISDHNSLNLTETTTNTINNPETLRELVNKSLLNPDEEKNTSSIKEASMTELAAEVPLPDEDDLDKELNMPTDQTDASTLLNGLPLDLVDNSYLINKNNLTFEIAEQVMQVAANNEERTILSEQHPSNPLIFESRNNIQNEILTLDTKISKTVPEVLKDIIQVKNENPSTDEQQFVALDVSKSASSINVETENKSIIDDVQFDNEVINNTETVMECLNETVTYTHEENKRFSQSMDINDSVIRPLPDIINQTNIVPTVESTILSENLENAASEVSIPGILPEPAKVIPELLSDVSAIPTHMSELSEVIKEVLPIKAESDEMASDTISDSTATEPTEDTPVSADLVIDTQPNYVDVIPTEPEILDSEKQPINPVSDSTDNKTEDDEIVLSENNSPFVSVIAEDIPKITPEENIDIQNIDQQIVAAGKVVITPPASPPITSKGYNFNFDEIDDPFATKTKIRVSPSSDTPTKVIKSIMSSKSVEKPMPKKEMINRRKSQPERKKLVAPKRKFNSTFNDGFSGNTAVSPAETFAVDDINMKPPPNVTLKPINVSIEEKLIAETKMVHEKTLDLVKEVSHQLEQELKPEIEEPVLMSSAETDESATSVAKDSKSTSSSEQSAYFSAGASSNESFHSRNVFNIPEIDDKNFNPFASKSKMRQSPPPNLNIENPFATKSKISNSPESSMILPHNDEIVKPQDTTNTVLREDKVETELSEKDVSGNLSNTTTSSKATDDKDGTIKEVNTEDEDTIEGPFLEAEDLNVVDKMSDYDSENNDMMQFNDLPTQVNEENGDNDELFIDAEAFEFLLNQNKSDTVVDSGKESLFLKFDPLFAKRMSSITSENLFASLNKIQKRQSTPTKAVMPEKEVMSPIAGPSNLNITQETDITQNSSEEFNEDLNITVSKPMMVVPPAVNPVTPRNKSLTPNRSNRRSITFTSPAMAVIDRLLSLSGNNSLLHETTVTHATREQNEADLALVQLRELLAEKEINVYSLRSESKELKDRLTLLESHLKSLEDESQTRLKKINDLNDRLAEKTKINKSMAAVVEEYERTIARLISETAQDKKRHAEERAKLINERDEQTAHLASMEVSFSDLHSKYEKIKQVILHCKANEDAYKKSIKAFEENLNKMQNNYELLKQHATSKLNHANQELDKMNRSHEAEVLKLNAMIKRKELHITSLEESLAQKTKANDELTAICDELINKVGG